VIRFRGDVEGLRAVAVLLVILNHLAVPGFGGGFIGVDVFFVISGFLITSLLAAEHAREAERGRGRISITGFYLRRARRILPAAVLVVAVVLVAAHSLVNPLRAADIQHDALWALLFGSNINFIQKATDYFQQGLATSPLQHYWSLAVEEQFYLVWPALFALVTRVRSPRSWERRVALGALLLGGASLAWSVSDTATDPASAYFSSLTRGWELALGALIAIAARRTTALPARVAEALGAAGVALLVLACLTIDDTTPFPGTAALLPALGTGALLLAGTGAHATVVARTLSLRPARFVGRISYSMYLWHWPLIVFAQALYPIGSTSIAGRLTLLAATVAVSTTCFHLVEQPFRRLGHAHGVPATRAGERLRARRRARRRQLGTGLTATAAILVLAWSLLSSAGGPVQASASAPTGTARPGHVVAHHVPDVSPLTTARLKVAVPAGLTVATVPPSLFPISDHMTTVAHHCEGQAYLAVHDSTCAWGIADAPRRVVLLGDSHALMFAPALRGALAGLGYSGSVMWLGLCGWETAHGRGMREERCAAFQRTAWAELATLHPDVLILSQIVVGSPDSMRTALRTLKPLASKIVILAHTPRLPTYRRCMGAGWDVSACNGPRPTIDAERKAASVAGVILVDPNDWLCTDTDCPSIIDGTFVYTDGQHLSEEFSLRLATPLHDALAPVIPAR
jgi:peptidoglycan/LPS O-acetylase OafA/YrhL